MHLVHDPSTGEKKSLPALKIARSDGPGVAENYCSVPLKPGKTGRANTSMPSSIKA